jgi:drug/metabolite transporter (DMT)-like permease
LGPLLALLAAVGYGVGDFVGGVGGRRTNAAFMPIPVHVVGASTAVAAVSIGYGGPASATVLLWGAVSGIGSGIGNATLLRGLAHGSMSVVAPLSAVVTTALPAIVGLASGDDLAVTGWAGIVLALPAVALTSWSGGGSRFDIRDIGYGVLAGVGFGLLFIALDRAGTDSGVWPLVPGQFVALVIVASAAVPEFQRLRRDRQRLDVRNTAAWGVAAGVLGSTANILFLIASGAEQLTVVAVLAGLYPAVTVALAALVVRERIRPPRLVGLVGSAISVVVIVLGS